MTEKNIIVNRGIPPGTSSGSASSFGGHQETGLSGTSSSTHIGTIYIGTPGHSPFFGAGWHNINSTTGLEHGAGGGLGSMSVTIDGATHSPGHTVARSPVYLMQGALEESLGSGHGWLPYEAYSDLGLDFWKTLPFQLVDARQEIVDKYNKQRKNKFKVLNAELINATATHNSINTTNSSLKHVQKKLSEWEDILSTSIALFIQHPAKDYLSRTIKDIMSDLNKINEYNVPEAIDKELAGLSAACEAANDLAIRDALESENAKLVDHRSMLQTLAQAKMMARLSSQEQAKSLASQPLFDMDYLTDKEGGLQVKGYVPMDRGIPVGRSGVTIGVGVDLGRKTESSLLKDGVSQSLVTTLSEYTGLLGQQALEKIKQKPLTLSNIQAQELTHIYFEKISTSIEKRYNSAAGNAAFRTLPFNTRTAIIDMAFQYGDNLSASVPKSWSMMITGDWQGLIIELNNFGDSYPSRRKSEAKLIESDFNSGLLKQSPN